MGATSATTSTKTQVVAVVSGLIILVSVLLVAFVVGPRLLQARKKHNDQNTSVASTEPGRTQLPFKLPGVLRKKEPVSVSDEESMVGARPAPVRALPAL